MDAEKDNMLKYARRKKVTASERKKAQEINERRKRQKVSSSAVVDDNPVRPTEQSVVAEAGLVIAQVVSELRDGEGIRAEEGDAEETVGELRVEERDGEGIRAEETCAEERGAEGRDAEEICAEERGAEGRDAEEIGAGKRGDEGRDAEEMGDEGRDAEAIGAEERGGEDLDEYDSQEEEVIEEDEGVEEEGAVQDDVADVQQTAPAGHPGGPSDTTIIKSFKSHIATDIWDNNEREPLKCLSHGGKALDWTYSPTDPNRTKLAGFVKASGLSVLSNCSFKHLDRVLVNAFIERWIPETNSFHMPFGEMTVTLDDVSTILGLKVTGLSVIPPPASDDVDDADDDDVDGADDDVDGATSTIPHIYTAKALGISADEAYKEMYSNNRRGTSLKLKYLKDRFQKVTDANPEKEVEGATRAYLLYLLGCTLFADKSGTRVSCIFLRLLQDLDKVNDFAWGAACLAYLYRQLGYATRKQTKQVSGYLTLLEAWIYEHFVKTRPRLNPNYNVEKPLVFRWKVVKENRSTHLKLLQELRAELDELTGSEVVWDPYVGCRDKHPFPPIAFYSGCIACMDVVEPYHPDRVMPQLGMVQCIPQLPIAATTYRREEKIYKVSYNYTPEYFEQWESHLLAPRYKGRLRTQNDPHCESEYVEWYSRISHRIIANPAHRSTPNNSRSSASSSQQQAIDTALEAAISILQNERPRKGS